MSVFKITVQYQTRDGYPAVAEFSQADRFLVRAERRLRLDEDALIELRCCEDAAEYGRRLGEALFQGSLLEAFIRARATGEDRTHVLLCIEPPELRALSWERLQAPLDDGRWDFLALDQRVPLSIYTPSSTDRRFLAFGPPDLRALVVAASPRRLSDYGLAPFATAAAVAAIGGALGAIPYAALSTDETAPHRLGAPTLDGLCELLTAERYTLLHVICHGQLRPDGETVLYLDAPDGSVRPVPAAQLIGRLGRLRGAHGLPHFMFLAACESAHPDAEAALGGLGQRLVRELGMPAVVAMTARVSLELATELARRFYPQLRRHGAVDVALVEANAGLAEHTDVLVPALYSRLGDRPLFSDRDNGRPLGGAELGQGLARLEALLPERAPTLVPELATAARQLRTLLASDGDAGAASAAGPGLAALLVELDALASEAVERTFRHLALGRPVPDYDGRCPFPGLNAFQSDDSAFFFGREELSRRMCERLLTHRFLAVLGPSGSGKSSVVLAGVVPRLRQHLPGLGVQIMTPGREPLPRLAHLLSTGAVSGPCVLVVDQLEEAFTLCQDPRQRGAFFERLLALRGSCFVVVTLRADFWGECAVHPALKDAMLADQELVGPMGAAELRSAIEQQVAAVGLRFEDGLCSTMLAAIEEEPGGMPLLQHTLLELWKRRRGPWLRSQEYRNLGGVQRAIAETAESVFQLSAAVPEEQQRMRDVFTRLTHLDDARPSGRKPRDSRRCVRFSELVPAGTEPEAMRRLITRLADARLVVTHVDAVSGELEVEVAHEAVIRHWPRLGAWLDEDRIAIGFREGVRQAAREWRAGGHPAHLLLHRGERLRMVRELGRSLRQLFNQEEQDYIDACFAAQEEADRQKEEQQRREQQYARDLAVALERALVAARSAQSRQLAMHASAVCEHEPMLALLLGREAARILPTAEALSQLQSILTHPLERAILRGHGDAVVSGRFSPDGGLLLTASMDRSARLWDREGRLRAVLRGHGDAVLDAAWSPDGGRALTLSSDKTARVWGRDGELQVVLAGHTAPVLSGCFSPDGERILTCSSDQRARLWGRDGQPLATLVGHGDAVMSGCFAPDGGRLLTTSKDRTARLWSAVGAPERTLIGHTAPVAGGCFAPDGELLLTVSWDSTGRLWQLDGRLRATLSGHTDRVNDGCFSGDGQSVLTVSRDHTARLWDRGGQLQAVLRGHEKGVQRGCFSGDGGRLLTVSGDGTARLWERDGHPLAVLRGHEKGVHGGGFTSDGTGVATVSWDGTARLWPGGGSCSVALRGHTGPITQLAISPDGTQLLTAATDGTARLWRTDGRLQAVLRGHGDAVTGALFSLDGARVLTVSRDCSACLWSRDGAALRWLLGHGDALVAGAFSPDGEHVVTASIDGSAWLWGRDSAPVALLVHGDAALTGCCFSPTSDRVLTTAADGSAALWTLDGRRQALMQGHRDAVPGGLFSPDGSRILTASWDGTACLFSRDGQELARLGGHAGALLGGCFSPDGQRILTFSRDHTARLFSSEGQTLAVLRGHRDWVLGGCFNRRGDGVLTVSRDGTARLWSGAGAHVMTLRGHRDWVTVGLFATDDRLVVTAAADHTARLWPATVEALGEVVERHAARELSASEREAYLDFERQ